MTYLGKKVFVKLLSVRFKPVLIIVGSGPQQYLKAFLDKYRETEY